VWPT